MIPEDLWLLLDEKKDDLSDYALALALDHGRATTAAASLPATLPNGSSKRRQTANGLTFWKTAGFSRWADDPHEITAMAFKALVAHDADNPLLPGVLAYFNVTKHGNRWNSTKDTALIVQALCDYLDKAKRGSGEGTGAAGVPLQRRPRDPGRASTIRRRSRKSASRPSRSGRVENTITFTDAAPWVVYRLVLRHWSAEREIKPSEHGVDVAARLLLAGCQGQARPSSFSSGDAIPRGSFLESVVHARCLTPQQSYVLVENPRPCPLRVPAGRRPPVRTA